MGSSSGEEIITGERKKSRKSLAILKRIAVAIALLDLIFAVNDSRNMGRFFLLATLSDTFQATPEDVFYGDRSYCTEEKAEGAGDDEVYGVRETFCEMMKVKVKNDPSSPPPLPNPSSWTYEYFKTTLSIANKEAEDKHSPVNVNLTSSSNFDEDSRRMMGGVQFPHDNNAFSSPPTKENLTMTTTSPFQFQQLQSGNKNSSTGGGEKSQLSPATHLNSLTSTTTTKGKGDVDIPELNNTRKNENGNAEGTRISTTRGILANKEIGSRKKRPLRHHQLSPREEGQRWSIPLPVPQSIIGSTIEEAEVDEDEDEIENVSTKKGGSSSQCDNSFSLFNCGESSSSVSSSGPKRMISFLHQEILSRWQSLVGEASSLIIKNNKTFSSTMGEEQLLRTTPEAEGIKMHIELYPFGGGPLPQGEGVGRRVKAVQQILFDNPWLTMIQLSSKLSENFIKLFVMISVYTLVWGTILALLLLYGTIGENMTVIHGWIIFNILYSLLFFMIDDWIQRNICPYRDTPSLWLSILYSAYKPLAAWIVLLQWSELKKLKYLEEEEEGEQEDGYETTGKGQNEKCSRRKQKRNITSTLELIPIQYSSRDFKEPTTVIDVLRGTDLCPPEPHIHLPITLQDDSHTATALRMAVATLRGGSRDPRAPTRFYETEEEDNEEEDQEDYDYDETEISGEDSEDSEKEGESCHPHDLEKGESVEAERRKRVSSSSNSSRLRLNFRSCSNSGNGYIVKH